jgi:hypothetical protein
VGAEQDVMVTHYPLLDRSLFFAAGPGRASTRNVDLGWRNDALGSLAR